MKEEFKEHRSSMTGLLVESGVDPDYISILRFDTGDTGFAILDKKEVSRLKDVIGKWLEYVEDSESKAEFVKEREQVDEKEKKKSKGAAEDMFESSQYDRVQIGGEKQ